MENVTAVFADQHEGIATESLHVEALEPCSSELVLLPSEFLPATHRAPDARVAEFGFPCLGHHPSFLCRTGRAERQVAKRGLSPRACDLALQLDGSRRAIQRAANHRAGYSTARSRRAQREANVTGERTDRPPRARRTLHPLVGSFFSSCHQRSRQLLLEAVQFLLGLFKSLLCLPNLPKGLINIRAR